MKKARRILALLLIMVMALTAVPVTAGAASIYDTAVAITSGQKASTSLYNINDTADFKINVTKAGELKLLIDSDLCEIYVKVMDADGNAVDISSYNMSSGKRTGTLGGVGYDYIYLRWNASVEKIKGTVSYGVQKGTYYIRIRREEKRGGNNLSVTATAPAGTSNAKISYLSLTLSKGATLQLGAVVSPSGSKVTWKSSKPAVATVSSNGKITAKAEGATIITAKCGTSTHKIRIVVK